MTFFLSLHVNCYFILDFESNPIFYQCPSFVEIQQYLTFNPPPSPLHSFSNKENLQKYVLLARLWGTKQLEVFRLGQDPVC